MPLEMTAQELRLFVDYTYETTGIRLDESKKYFLETRLQEVLGALGCGSYAELFSRSRQDATKGIERQIVDCVTTNETYFFRDKKPFDLLKLHLLPELFGDDPARPLSIWSAAASRGQEGYSVAMVLKELLFDLSRCRVKIYGTDVSEAAVSAANRGEFTRLEVTRGLTEQQVARNFTPAGERFRIADDLRSLCRFAVDNLLAPRTVAGPYDVILCRNVLIYFSPDDQRRVLDLVARHLRRDGKLIVGSTESLLNVTDTFRREEKGGATYYVLR